MKSKKRTDYEPYGTGSIFTGSCDSIRGMASYPERGCDDWNRLTEAAS